MFKLRYLKTGEILDLDYEGNTVRHKGYNLIIGFDGKVYEVSGWAYDGAGGYSLEEANDYELVVIQPDNKRGNGS